MTIGRDFRSDNIAIPSRQMLDAIAAAAGAHHDPYGTDEITARLRDRLGMIFDKEVEIFPIVTGTAGNALALSMVMRSFGRVLCHADSHIVTDECGAIEFISGGGRVEPIAAEMCKLTPRLLELHDTEEDVHRLRIGAVSISQATERGTVYSATEITGISAFSRSRAVPLHMDGTRLHNALVSTATSASALTWRSGVDVLCLGATKGGALAAECVVFFDRTLAQDFGRQVKRTGHLLAKGWLISAQLEAYFQDDLWLRNARHANAMAKRLGEALSGNPRCAIEYPVEANMVFVRMDEALAEALEKAGFGFYRYDGGPNPLARFVMSHSTGEADVEALVECLA